MPEYRILQSVNGLKKGAVKYLAKSHLQDVAEKSGLEPWEFAIPTDLGLSWVEKDPVTLREISDDRVPLPVSEPVDTSDLVKSLQELEKKLAHCQTTLTETTKAVESLVFEKSLVGVSPEEGQEITDLLQKQRRWERKSSESEGQLVTLRAQLGYLQRPGLEIDGRRARLKELAGQIGQYPGLIDDLGLSPSWWGRLRWQYGLQAETLFREFAELLAEYVGVETHELKGVQERADVAALLSWAQEQAEPVLAV